MERDHVLSEIRRTAVLSGRPLGRERFFKETGIRESDWHGKYWVRWGDAIREAGFEPNQLNASYDDEELLSSLAKLVRELGHFPVAGELKLKARQDPECPSPNRFRRLGDKRSLAARLCSFSEQRGRNDVAALCALVTTGSPAAEFNEPTLGRATESEEFGFVYLLKSGRFYKIGRTDSAGRRERELAIQLPERCKIVHSIRTDDPAGIEEYWHKRFGIKRKNGEWFDLAPSDAGAFRRRKSM